MIYTLYNPLSNNRQGEQDVLKLRKVISGQMEFIDITKIDVRTLQKRMRDDDEIILAGGDGTLNHFINDFYEFRKDYRIRYYQTGTGNDLSRDITDKRHAVIEMNPIFERLPQVTVNGKNRLFLNGIGFGLDGYCCEKSDEIREKTGKKANYSLVALKGLLLEYEKRNAKVTVDGVTTEYTDVLMAPTMNGKYYGGGVMIAPNQSRFNEEGTVTLVVVHNLNKFRTLMIFPTIYRGKHVKYTDVISVFTGHEITVEYDRPTPLQIDGETISGVTKYTVVS